MSKKPNKEIRDLLSMYHLQRVEIAYNLQITEGGFNWLMRKELPKNTRKKVLAAINSIVAWEGL